MTLFITYFRENIFILLLIILWALGSWIYIFGVILWQLLTLDNYDYYIKDKKTLIYHLGYILMVLGICYYLFCIRLGRRGFSLDLDLLYHRILNFAWDQPVLALFILVVGMIIGLFFILMVQVILLYIKRSLLSIYLYMCYYERMRRLNYWFIDLVINFNWFFGNWVLKCCEKVWVLKHNQKIWIFGISMGIWPISRNFVENTIYRFIIPYLILFDIYCNYGVISKIFMVLPWYFIYSIIRGFILIFYNFNDIENWDKSEELYGLDINNR